MCSVAGSSHSLPTTTAPRYSGSKRPLTLTLAAYDDPAAAAERRANAAASLSAPDASALVPFMASPSAAAPANHDSTRNNNAYTMMCSAAGSNVHSLPTTAAPRYAAGCKRPLELTLAVYDDPAAAEEQRANTSSLSAPDAAALVPFMALPSPRTIPREPINAVPVAVAAPNDERAEPWWLRTRLFQHLRLRFDLPVHFIAEKAVTATDLDRHQNRFRLPSEGVVRNLRPVLTPLELAAANLLHEEAPRPRPPKQQQQQQQLQLVGPDDVPAAAGERERKKKRKGKKHSGLPVLVVDSSAGIRELQLSRWDSSGGTIIKGEGYLDFIARCSFTVDDVVEVWAFKDRTYRYFGVDLCVESPLYVLITKKGQTQRPAV